MWRLVVISLAATACTVPNPRSCADGLCTDQRYPFCDVDGSLDGHPMTCIAVACTAGEFVACRADQAITCNVAGNDHELIQCELGCAPAAEGCRSCTGDQHCSNPQPICEETTSTCIPCTADDQCSSRICSVETGECAAESSVVYATPSGTGQCSVTQPCSLTTAIMLATQTSPAPTLRMLPGVYTMPISLAGPWVLNVVATGATLAPTAPALTISDGADVTIRGLTIVNEKVATCSSTSGAITSLQLKDASITALGVGNTTLIDVSRCKLEISRSDLSLAATSIVFSLGDDAVLNLDRAHLHGNSYHSIYSASSRVTIEITNSLLHDIRFSLYPADTGPPGSRLTVGSSTLIYPSMFTEQGCDVQAPTFIARYENSILAPLGAFDAVIGTRCTFSNTLLSFQATPPPGTFVADPQFVDAAARNFHLKATSPAVDMAVPSIFGLDSTADLDGTPRPQGATPDIGAYELKP
jgi:hypothetical protein